MSIGRVIRSRNCFTRATGVLTKTRNCLPRCSSTEDDTGSFTEYLRKPCKF
jgi:hypothetical protein